MFVFTTQPASPAETNGYVTFINFRTRFVELPDAVAKPLMNEFLPSYKDRVANLTTNQVFSTVLDTDQAKDFLKRCQQIPGVLVHNSPELTAKSGLQAQIISTSMFVPAGDNRATITNRPAFGFWIDLIPAVGTDGFRMNMSPVLRYTTDETGIQLFTPSERLPTGSSISPSNVWDGQTMVLAAIKYELTPHKTTGSNSNSGSPSDAKKFLLVFMTPTLIDGAGNRVHSDDEVLAAQKRLALPAK